MSIGITIVVNNPSISTKLTSINGALSGTALVNKYYAKYSPDGSISEENTQTMLSINKKQKTILGISLILVKKFLARKRLIRPGQTEIICDL